MLDWIAAGLLIVIAAAHSALGERAIVGPLLRSDGWQVRVPRPAADRILRFAWHLTSLAWVALAAALLGAAVPVVFAAVCLSAFVIIIIATPGHVAWPLFLAAGLAALGSAELIPEWLMWGAIAAATVVAAVASGFHFAWAFGVRRGTRNVIPQRPDGLATIRPDGPATAAVALALLFLAGLIWAVATDRGGAVVTLLTSAALIVLCARVMGDGRWVGVTKRVRDTGFARADDRYWTPAAAVLALGCAAALALG